MNLAGNVVWIRALARHTQDSLAEKSRVSRKRISEIENGKKGSPSIDTLTKLVRACWRENKHSYGIEPGKGVEILFDRPFAKYEVNEDLHDKLERILASGLEKESETIRVNIEALYERILSKLQDEAGARRKDGSRGGRGAGRPPPKPRVS